MKLNSLKTQGFWAAGILGAFVLGSILGSKFHSQTNKNTQGQQGANGSVVRVSERGPDSLSSAGGGTFRTRAERLAAESSVTDSFSKKLPAGDPDALAKLAFTDPNPIVRRMAFAKLLDSVTAENAPQIREQLTALGARGQEIRDFNYTWGALGGEEAFNTAALGNKRDLESLMSGWAAVDPDGAIAMLANLPEDLTEEKERLEGGLVAGLADRDQKQAAAYVQAMADAGNENAARFMGIVVGEVMRESGYEQASVWVEGLADGPLKGRAMDRVAGRYVRENPIAASVWIEQFAGEEYAAEAVREVGSEWAERDPDSAVSWLDRLPEGDGQKAALNSAFDDWEDKDPVAAGTYLVNMPSSPKRDSAISGFAVGLAAQEPETAIAWANEISDPQLRERSLTRSGQIFFSRNPEAAKAWLATSGLPANLQAEIQKPRRGRRR